MMDSKGAAPISSNDDATERDDVQELMAPHNDEDGLGTDDDSLKSGKSGDAVIKNRDVWDNKIEFLMASISTAVGLGNVWRFPFTAYAFGGGSFLIPYIIVVVFIVKPLYFVEVILGQFSSRGPVGIWDMAPMFRGVGVAQVVISFCTGVFYTGILANCVLYFYHSCKDPLPWVQCNTKLYKGPSIFLKNLTCKNDSTQGGTWTKNGTAKDISSSELFFRYVATKTQDNVDHGLGTPDLALTMSLLIVWLLVFCNMLLGTKTSGKGAYFTALFPYVVLFVLFVLMLTQKGSGNGVAHFFTPKWEKLGTVDVWFSAIGQAFFSLGVGYGGITTYGSYNPFRQLPWNETVIVGVVDLMTSLLAGIIVFGTLGVLTEKIGASDIDNVVGNGGPGLAFVSYPELVSRIGSYPGPQFFATIFFIMLLTLGIGSSSSFVQCISGALFDQYPILISRNLYKACTMGGICFTCFILGLVFTTPAGWHMIDFVGFFSSDFVVYVVVTVEICALSYVYGFKAFVQDLGYMFDQKRPGCGCVCLIFTIWGYVVPFLLLIVLGATFSRPITIAMAFLGEVFEYPRVAKVFGWLIFAVIVGLIPVLAVYVFITRKSKTLRKKFLACVKPNSKWGPKDPEEKKNWIAYRKLLDSRTVLFRLLFGKCTDPHKSPILATPMPSTHSKSKIILPGSASDEEADASNVPAEADETNAAPASAENDENT